MDGIKYFYIKTFLYCSVNALFQTPVTFLFYISSFFLLFKLSWKIGRNGLQFKVPWWTNSLVYFYHAKLWEKSMCVVYYVQDSVHKTYVAFVKKNNRSSSTDAHIES
jgi:hypothetical protein